MRWKFWQRDDDDDEFEDVEEDLEPSRPPPEFPRFAMIISDNAVNGWHVAAVIRERANIDYYVRALVVRWPFVIARPSRSNRQSDTITDKHELSPASTGPARKLVVNWGWEPVDDEASQLRFYAKRRPGLSLRKANRLRVRLTVKEMQSPRRRMVVWLKSNAVVWKPPDPVSRAQKKRRFRPAED